MMATTLVYPRGKYYEMCVQVYKSCGENEFVPIEHGVHMHIRGLLYRGFITHVGTKARKNTYSLSSAAVKLIRKYENLDGTALSPGNEVI